MNVKLEGIADQIAAGAVRAGLAKTKTDAILLGLVELEHHYRILERYENEIMYAVAKKISDRINSSKEKLLSEQEFKKKTGARF